MRISKTIIDKCKWNKWEKVKWQCEKIETEKRQMKYQQTKQTQSKHSVQQDLINKKEPNRYWDILIFATMIYFSPAETAILRYIKER